MEQVLALISKRSPVIASIFVLLTTVFLLSRYFGSDVYEQIPLVGKELGNAEKRRKAYLDHAQDIYQKGYSRFKNRVFRLTGTDGDRIVLPRHLVDEVKDLPDDYISINKAFEKMNEEKYIKFGQNPDHGVFLVHVIRADLTRNLNRINPQLAAEAAFSVINELPPCDCDDWTPVVIYEKLLRIVAIVSGRIFLGPELCREEAWLHHAIHFTVDVFRAITKLKQWHPLLRPIGQYFIPELRGVAEHRRKAQEFLKPVILQRREMMRQGGPLPDDMLQWMLNKAEESNVGDNGMSEMLLGLSLAAIHTTTMTTTLALYDLVVRPDLVQEIREEIKSVLAANNGVISLHALYDMKLLDSLLKESQRTNVSSLVRFVRHVDKPVTLSDGTHLPAGAIIESPHKVILNDPERYSNPETFDPYRFMNLRTGNTADPLNYNNKEQYQFVTVTKDFMAFGYGRHACPGRFFAANEIKLILSRLLVEYDIKMPENITERYANITSGLDEMPDTTKEIMMRRVKSDEG
ncbi:ent-kaurene oxidase [Pseudomassariella vexata]|uniref:Ent-kaurene oxidase n=1 Tax=Pseudomassariella vexata TaxID=1141098 RepID=A0A1Y2DIU5_9PEZI|nr:ent-kaurene oxidase [Pseudomassariella vexata]ORY59096.1 ent-kaurene oxidase [Pseudomassariella vexata]